MGKDDPANRRGVALSPFERARRRLIARRLPLFALGWLCAMGLWLVVFTVESRLTLLAVLVVSLQAALLLVVFAVCRANPGAPRVLTLANATCALLGISTTVFFALIHGQGELSTFVAFTLCLAAALVFCWGWQAELAMLGSMLVPWILTLPAFSFFFTPLELAAAVTSGWLLSLAVAEGAARSFRAEWLRRTSNEEMTRVLAESRDAYRDLAETAQDLIWAADLDGRLTYVNDATGRFFGASPRDLLGRPMAEFMTDDPSNLAPGTAIARLLAGESLPTIELQERTPCGPRRLEVLASAIHGPDGTIVGMRGISRDITERRVAEEALRASEARYRGVIESAVEVVARVDLGNRIIFANDSFCRSVGYTREQIIGQSFHNLIHLIHEEDRATVLNAFQAVTVPPYRCRIENRQLTPEGWRWFEWEGAAIRDANGRILEIQSVGRDVTHRKQAEADLRESEERFRSAFEDASIGMAIAAPDGRGLRVNRAFCDMLGYSEAEMLGMTAQDITHPDDLEATIAAAGRILNGEARSYQLEKRYLHKRGHVVWVSATSSLVRDANGTPLYFLAQMQDTTERKAGEEALRASLEDLRRSEETLRLLAQRQATIREEERTRLGFDLHDDVCQELVGIGILAASLHRKMSPMPPEQAAEFSRLVAYVAEVVEHLRLLAHELRPMLLHDLGLEGSLCALADGMSSAETRVVADFRTPIPRSGAEAEVAVYRIAQEALTNAARHAHARSIVVSVEASDGRLCLEIQDDGRGFDPAAPHAKALGLVGMEERALALGGRFMFRSAPGQGTTVRLECPFIARASASAA